MLLPKKILRRLPPVIHGGIIYNELKDADIQPQNILDFSTNCNPFGPPPGTDLIIKNIPISNYPDSDSNELRIELANKLKLRPDNFITGSGSTEIIRLISTAFLEKDKTVVVLSPTYSEYELSSKIFGARVTKVNLSEEHLFKLDIQQITKKVTRLKPTIVFLCNPNNPTGQYLSKEEVVRICNESKDTLFVIDEAYIAFTDNIWDSLDLIKKQNIIIIRSMTKDYALAGLRIGYAISNPLLISYLNKIKPPWNVSSVAQKVAIFALRHDKYIHQCSIKIREAKELLIKELSNIGFKIIPSQTNFFLIKVKSATKAKNLLLKKCILVRDCSSFGLVNYIRVAPRSIADCQKLISAFKEMKDYINAS